MKTLFLYQDPNFFHAELARAIGADFHPTPRGIEARQPNPLSMLKNSVRIMHYAATIPSGYDVYLCESNYIYPAMAKRMGRLGKAKIINILASPLLYYIKTGTGGMAERKLGRELLKNVDGFIALGEMGEELLHSVVQGAHVIRAYPFIKPYLRSRLGADPDVDAHKILFMGSKDPRYKGIDLLIGAYKLVKKDWPDAELTIAGDIHEVKRELMDAQGVRFRHYEDRDVPKLVKESSIYVHLGRGDTYPMTVVEAMYGGLPAIVSQWTGTRDVVSKLNKNFVVPLNAAAAAKQIARYFTGSSAYRKVLSKKARALASKYTVDRSITNFKRDYKRLLAQLE